ncbi:hypothetical protein VPH35_025549 [Triticum aestivum]
MAPSDGPGGDPAAGEGVTLSDHRARPSMRDRPAAAGECEADGVAEEAAARRGCYPNPAPRGCYPNPAPRGCYPNPAPRGKQVVVEETSGKGAPADGVQDVVQRLGLCRHPARRRPLQFGECTSAAGAEEAVRTCSQIGPAASCAPVASGGRGGGGGRGDRGVYIDGCTSRPQASKLAPTSDPAPKVICWILEEEGDIDKCKGYKPSAAHVSKATREPPKPNNEVQLSSVKGTGPDGGILKADIEDYLDAPAAPSESKAAQEPAEPKVEEKVPAKDNNVSLGGVNGNSTCSRTLINRVPSAVPGINSSLPCGRVASASSFSSCAASVAKGGKSESFAASGLDCTYIPNAQIRKVTADRLLASKQTIPHYYLTVDTPVDKLIKLRGELNPLQEASGGKKISKDLVRKDADKTGLPTIGEEVKQLAQRARDNSLKPQDYEAFSDFPDFFCSDKGGYPGSSNGKCNYISKMNFYLRAGSMSDDMMLVSDGEESSNYSLRFEELKGFKNSSNNSKGLVQKVDSDYYTEGVSQVFLHLCGTTISHQENLYTSNVNMLMKAACDKVVLDPEQLLSYYQINKDSKIIINARLRGGCAGDKTWDDIIRSQKHYTMVSLPPEDLVLLRRDGSAQQGPILVKYLAAPMQFRSRNVLIQLCRKHYSGTSYGGKITSKNILFDRYGNVRIDSAPETLTQHSAKLDYEAIGKILDDSFQGKVYPMHFYQLVDFLRYGPAVDCQSEAVIAFVTNHVSLLSHYVRVSISEILVQLVERLHPDVRTALLNILDQFAWANTVKNVAAMKYTYFYHSRNNQDGTVWVPYVDDGVSFLKFSNNFFKHHKWTSLEKLDAAFSLMEKRNFIPRFLLTILVTLKDSENQCPALIQSFIDQVVEMLGNNVIDLQRG